MRHRVVHLINPKTDSLTTRPLYLNRALYSPLAGLLAVAGGIPPDRYDVVLTDENIESIDFDLKADLVGISAMTSYVKRGYEIAVRSGRGGCQSPWAESTRASCRRRRSNIATRWSSARRNSCSISSWQTSNKAGCAAPIEQTGCIRWKVCRCRGMT